jgi:hypothetical protein
MKHVIVIETSDVEAGGREIPPSQERALVSIVDEALTNLSNRECFIRSIFNVPSALAAVHEIYGVPNCQHPEGV